MTRVTPGINQPEALSMSNKVVAIALAVIGLGLLVWGYQMSGSVGSQLSHTFTGSYTDKVMMLYISGAASFIVGAYLFLKK